MDTKNQIPSLRRLVNWALPAMCLGCTRQAPLENLLCGECRATLPYLTDCCDRCSRPYTGPVDHCGRCLTDPPPFDRCISVFKYEDVIRDFVHRLKYGDNPPLANVLALYMYEEILARETTLPDLLIPVPLHRARLRIRGYNQASLLCTHLSRHLSIPWSSNAARKTVATPPQASLTLKQRQANLRDSFKIQAKSLPPHVAIVDDVFTTGTTAIELAKTLRKAGVKTIQVWVFAQTL